MCKNLNEVFKNVRDPGCFRVPFLAFQFLSHLLCLYLCFYSSLMCHVSGLGWTTCWVFFKIKRGFYVSFNIYKKTGTHFLEKVWSFLQHLHVFVQNLHIFSCPFHWPTLISMCHFAFYFEFICYVPTYKALPGSNFLYDHINSMPQKMRWSEGKPTGSYKCNVEEE